MTGEREVEADRHEVGGLRALTGMTDAQRLAAEAAKASFRLFAPSLAGNGQGPLADDPEGSRHDDPFGIGELRRSMRRAVDLYLELAERMFDLSTRAVEEALVPRIASLSGSGPEPAQGVLRVTCAPGERVTAPIWLHNMTDEPLAPGRFRCSDLLGSDGSFVRSAAVITPERTEPLAPDASLRALLAIDVPADAAAVVYVGHAVLVPVPDVALAIHLSVAEST
jgi:hypothetical protein